jgi:hypothetical protein
MLSVQAKVRDIVVMLSGVHHHISLRKVVISITAPYDEDTYISSV